MTTLQNRFIGMAAVAGLVACIGDFVITGILGVFYPNYNYFELVMSELGTSQSPVAFWINLWWILGGILYVILAIGFREVFTSSKRAAMVVMVLIMLFGVGAWTCGGVFPMEYGGGETTLAGQLHNICGGLGYIAITCVPLGALAIFSRKDSPELFWLSICVFLMGVVTLGLFVASEDAASSEGLLSYAGLWQRVFLLNSYLYLGVLAVLMIRLSRRSH